MATLSATKGDDNYARLPKGNLDVTGQYFIWTSNMGGDRLDAFMVRVPAHLLGGSPRAGAPRPGAQATRSSTLAGGAGATLSQVTR
jgi:hypothetical protein